VSTTLYVCAYAFLFTVGLLKQMLKSSSGYINGINSWNWEAELDIHQKRIKGKYML
jgi:hypothetical protein